MSFISIEAEHLVLIAGLVFTLGYLIINQVILRLMILTGTAFYIWYYAVVADAPLWTAIWTSCAMGLANVIGLLGLLAHNSRFAIPQAHRDLYPMFSELPPGDFRQIVQRANRYRVDETIRITQEGSPNDSVFFIVSGALRVTKAGERFRMPSGTFVGEVAYLTHQPAAASIDVLQGSEVLEWSVATLRKRAARKSRFKLALDAMFTRDLAAKVAFAVAPRSDRFLDS